MSSLFVPEDEEYDDKSETLFVPDEQEDPDHIVSELEHQNDKAEEIEAEYVEPENQPEISEERTRAHYARAMAQDEEGSIPVVREEKAEVTAIYESREVCCSLPLGFYQEIVENMLAKDGLLILGRGLGCEVITANLLYALSSPSVTLERGKTVTKKKSLVILLGAGEEEIVKLNDLLVELRWLNAVAGNDTENELEPALRVVGGSDLANTNKRRDMYMKGGVLSISSRILVVDILSGILKPSDITGFFVLHAEKIRETSNDSFIINLYRDQNDWGFVKAISDEPESFTGFTPLASKLKYLRMSNVFLWPRFHVEVTSSLMLRSSKQKMRSTVTEINVKLSKRMAKIQTAILSCLTACLQELKRHNPTLDTEYWDVENLHDTDFVTRVRLSLESQWHRISWTSKQLVYDLGTLKELLASLLRDDSLLFYQRVQGIVDTNIRSSGAGTMNATTMSPWLMMDEGTTITSYAKERALGRVTVATEAAEEGQEAAEVSREKTEVYNLEELPKWEQLVLLVDDIIHERSFDNTKTEGPILIMCSSSKTAQQLSSILSKAKKKVHEPTERKMFSCKGYMVSKLREYLQWKELISLTKRLNTELVEKANEDSREGTPDSAADEKLNTSKTFTRGNNVPRSKRRRTRGAAAVANVARLHSGSDYEKTAGPVDLEQDIVDRLEQDVKEEYDSNDELEEPELVEEKEQDETAEDTFRNFYAEAESPHIRTAAIDLEHIEKYNQVIIETYSDKTNETLLQELCPSYIIMYEPDLAFIRRVEVYHATNANVEPKTYFMYYGTSVEEQTHLMRIRKEKSAFTSLIREKANLGKRFAGEQENWKFHLRKPQVVNTRIAGGAKFRTEEDEMRVIVDSREFRSSLPNLLYRVGIQVIPCMLTVGDYVVSPKICVERKSIPDLIGSFKSGRLYQQCEQMFRHYELPTLLIEFDENKSFSFEPFAEIRPPGFKATNPIASKISKKEIQSKITELLISFPKLKVIWSSSPYETAQIFLELKASQHEPDVEEALAKGVNPAISTSEGPPMYNDDAIDLLQSIPGINNVNYTTVISRIRNIKEFVSLSKKDLHEMLGEENGNKAYNFVNRYVR
ncbi:uncharacterized protein CXQ87_002001 [Candidozyma duobushaemuli]|uniref:ERCC4 domain-containing protein n=1 Tax=Candidozyma duobushaemuli TaxID=1231522 RepID=A0A2V1A9F9_9ASCO|nr:uncharacterized protein CXQ87_002001 [[Candida] duobushaemulonis]PVH13883.1 hypothetical protein CXQ87_002001 [[Candida] duobushaemulonis]